MPVPGSQYTSLMGGSRNWNVHENYTKCNPIDTNVDTSYNDINTVTVLSNTVISFHGYKMNLTYFDSPNKMAIFKYDLGTTFNVSLSYFYSKDSMSYYSQYHGGACNYITYEMHTY